MPTLNPVRPSAPLRERYEARLLKMVAQMHADIVRTLTAAYTINQPEIVLLAVDHSPARALQLVARRIGKKWLDRFDELGPQMASYFATAIKDRNDRQMAADLRRAGITVRFKMTAAMNDAYRAVIGENVALIRSIAETHLTGVETLVMRSVQDGRDLGALTEGLTKQYGVTKRKAARIALDQNNKATAVLQRTRHLEMGITTAKWLHSAGGKTPRPDHVQFSGKTYSIAKGHDFDDGEGPVWPGTAINCRCVAIPVVPGFDD